MNIGKRIARARKAAGLTQNALAKKLYVNPTCISKWENGRIIPMPDTIIRLAKALKTDPNTLLGWEDE